jgi:hypothetical protein
VAELVSDLKTKDALTMDAASVSETSINFYQTTRRNNPAVSHLDSSRREDLKSHRTILVSLIGLLYRVVASLLKCRHTFTEERKQDYLHKSTKA